jgi:hypothetical protein
LSSFGIPDSIVLFFFCPAFCALSSAFWSSPGPVRPAPEAVRLCPIPAVPSIAAVEVFLMIGLGFIVFVDDSFLALGVGRDGPAGESAMSPFATAFDSTCD